MPMGFEAELSLSAICGGMLEEEFQMLYPLLLANLRDDKDKASISITIDVQRVPETTTILSLFYEGISRFTNLKAWSTILNL